MRPAHIYKILETKAWSEFLAAGIYHGSPVDLKDGYIHFSTAEQLQGTLDKHYKDGNDVIIASVTADAVKDALKYEVSRGGAEFPHLYAPLPMDAVSQHWVLSADAQGRYAVGEILTQ